MVSIDPGDSTGWSILECPGGHEIASGILAYREVPTWLDKYLGLYGPTQIAVIEDFSLFKNKALQQAGSKLRTVRVIGMFEYWAHINNVGVVFQSPGIKPIAQTFTQRVPRGAHKNSHNIDAYNHGAFYLHQRGLFRLPEMK